METANAIKDFALFALAAAIGVLPWLLDKMGVEMPKWVYAFCLIACFIIIGWALIRVGWIEDIPWVRDKQISVSVSSFVVGICTMAAILLTVVFSWPNRTVDNNTFGLDKTETISYKDFFNETIVIDNKIFDHCKFNNVQLMYHGLGNVTFIEPTWVGKNYARTDNQAAKVFGQLQYYFFNNPNVKLFEAGIVDGQGHIRVQQPTEIKPTTSPSQAKPPL